uniref:Uncharacterized protein n=1 Tax=Rhizophora mucronata TaxID=61149 RepID=A0A2P2Q6U2_RHIMU
MDALSKVCAISLNPCTASISLPIYSEDGKPTPNNIYIF